MKKIMVRSEILVTLQYGNANQISKRAGEREGGEGFMMQTRFGKVIALISKEDHLSEILTEVEGRTEKAYVYPHLTGDALPGDTVLLNTTAVSLGLGSGGRHFVQMIIGRELRDSDGPGHIMKLRYTPWQLKCQTIDEPGAAGHEILKDGGNLDGMSVVVAELHSQLAPICLMAKEHSPRKIRIVYIMPDWAALPIALSNTVRQLQSQSLIDHTITYGHAFGGDAEAVNIFSALLAARKVFQADLAVVAMGPGIVGTGTKYGFSGIEQGPALDAVAVMGGKAIAPLRIGFGDQRSRHHGISHHSLTVLAEIVQNRVSVPLPVLSDAKNIIIYGQLAASGIAEKHRLVEVHAEETLDLMEAHQLNVTTMGRGLREEPEFFMSAGAAGILAAQEVMAWN